MNTQQIRQLTNTAIGSAPADLVLINGSVLNVYTAELLANHDVAIKGERIAYVGPDARHTIGPQTQVIDATGQTLIPGLIDGHTHQDYFATITEYLRYIIPGGTTTLITETDSISNTTGYRGTRLFLDSLHNQPIKIYALAAPCVPLELDWKQDEPLTLEEIEHLLRLPEVLGLGEVYWAWIIDGNERLLQMVAQAQLLGKTIEGHSAGAKGKNLIAYAAAGIGSCHEPTTPQEALELLRLGMHVMLRQGSVRQDLTTLAPIKDAAIDFRRVALCTDAITPPDLLAHGYLENAVRQAIAMGFDPIKVIQMATINVAEHFQLDGEIGSIAPSRFGDILVIPDIHDVRPSYVISNGQVVAKDGQLVIQPRQHHFPEEVRHFIQIKHPFVAQDFVVHAPATLAPDSATVTVRALSFNDNNIITREEHVELPVIQGQVKTNPTQDILKIALVNRQDGKRRFVGYCRGFGIHDGALVSSVCWDLNAMVAIGTDDENIACALNRTIELGGGFVVSQHNTIIDELPFPLFGVTSDLPIEEIADRTNRITKTVRNLGSSISNPLLTIQTVAFAALPFLRITDQGLIDVRTRKSVKLFVLDN